jgi:hypothetical protein
MMFVSGSGVLLKKFNLLGVLFPCHYTNEYLNTGIVPALWLMAVMVSLVRVNTQNWQVCRGRRFSLVSVISLCSLKGVHSRRNRPFSKVVPSSRPGWIHWSAMAGLVKTMWQMIADTYQFVLRHGLPVLHCPQFLLQCQCPLLWTL